jgi:hypothetical protein
MRTALAHSREILGHCYRNCLHGGVSRRWCEEQLVKNAEKGARENDEVISILRKHEIATSRLPFGGSGNDNPANEVLQNSRSASRQLAQPSAQRFCPRLRHPLGQFCLRRLHSRLIRQIRKFVRIGLVIVEFFGSVRIADIAVSLVPC